MIQIKKTILTLVALLAVTTGAWAQTEITTIPNGDFETWTYDGEDMPNYWNSNATGDGSMATLFGGKQLKRSTDVRPGSSGQYSCSIWSKNTMGVINIGILTSGRIHFGSATFTNKENYIYSDRDGSNTKNNVTNPCAMPFTGKPTAIKVWVKYVQGGTGYGDYATAKFSATIHGDADYVAYNLAEHDNDDNKALVVASAEQEIAYNNGEWEQLTIPFNYTDNNVVPAYILINAYTNAYPGKGKANDYLYIDDIELEYAASASSGPEVAWDKAEKTGSFTMPGGNVTLEPEYYPQATVADGGVTAADADARATTDDPLVKVDATKLTGAKKLMYFVSNSGTTAPAYDAEGWTDQLPTAEGLTQQGIVYVWYYPVGTDEGVDGATATYSDGDICLQSITARIAPAPTYAVTFAEGTDPNEWTADPNAGVKKGQTVTVTYTGTKKVIGVKAEKKAAAPAGPITVTWNGADITGSGNSFTKDGVTITADDIEFADKNFYGPGTFTTTLGNFTKIEVTTEGWYASGTGWSGKTWTGNASSVSFSGDIMGYGGGNLKFVFTIEPTN